MTARKNQQQQEQVFEPAPQQAPVPVPPPSEPQPTPFGCPPIQGVFNYIAIGEQGQIYKVDEVTGELRVANQSDTQKLITAIMPQIQHLVQTSVPNYQNIMGQVQSLVNPRG